MSIITPYIGLKSFSPLRAAISALGHILSLANKTHVFGQPSAGALASVYDIPPQARMGHLCDRSYSRCKLTFVYQWL